MQVDFLSMQMARNRWREASDHLADEHRRVLDSLGGYRHAVSPELARALDSFSGRWTLALSSLTEVLAGAGDALEASQAAYQHSDDLAWQAMRGLRVQP
ncbi:hypothetical protein [Actinotalea sp. JY-7885]|uniref:hypothetical protein n=1 Tax=Actinotalea sp. JY-7885 TaxID=2758576 RepID=UPI00165E2EED|nr:hypothetical protein [Actinotalea sp. JY-7885]